MSSPADAPTGAVSASPEELGQAVYAAAALATRAPSIHNTQPWRFDVGPDWIELRSDPSRRLHVLDPDGRQMVLSCGAALVTARLSLEAAGLQVSTTLVPDPAKPDWLARLEVTASDAAPDAHVQALSAAVERRHTNRRTFTDEPLPEPIIATLRSAVESEGAWLHVVSGSDDHLVTAVLLQMADEAQKTDPEYHEELRHWTTSDPSRRDGVPTSAIPQVDTDRPQEIPVRDFEAGATGALPALAPEGRRQTLVVVGTDADDRTAWLQAGQALQRLLLETTIGGLVASPFTQVTEVPKARQRLRAELRLIGHPQVMLRMGRAEDTGATPRRPVDEVIARHDTTQSGDGGA